jgi:hypothetical protein
LAQPTPLTGLRYSFDPVIIWNKPGQRSQAVYKVLDRTRRRFLTNVQGVEANSIDGDYDAEFRQPNKPKGVPK